MSDDDRERERDLQGGGHAGAQGRDGEGHDLDASGAEIQGGSYGHSWDDTPADLAGGGRVPASGAVAGDADAGYTREDVHVALAVTDVLGELGPRMMERVTVRVEQGVATLLGSVRDTYAIELLRRVAGGVRGVRGVEIRLDVAPDAARVAPAGDRRASAADLDPGSDDEGRSPDRGSTESTNLQTGDIPGDLPTQP